MVGSPIAHSLSPVLHRAAYEALLLDWDYDAIEVGAGGLAPFVERLGAQWVGLSVTMPLKVEALHVARSADPVAARVGAANTLVAAGGGWHAYNTDVAGMQRVLADHACHAAAEATVLGGGATARSARAAIGSAAAEVVIVARDPQRAWAMEPLDEAVAAHAVRLDDTDALARALRAPLVINTTPAGALDHLAARLPALLAGHAPGCWVDVTYAPWPTLAAAAWLGLGGQVVGGLELLLAQAFIQVELMTGQPAPEEAMRATVALDH